MRRLADAARRIIAYRAARKGAFMAITHDLPSGAAVRRIRDLPGPPGLPLLGNSLQLDRQRVHQAAERWAQQYGETFRFRIATREFVVMSNPETVAAILRDRPDGFRRTPRLSETARRFGFDGLFSSNGEAWKRQRPMVLSGLAPTHIKAFFPTLVKVTDRFERRWRRAARAGDAIDLQADLMRYTVDVTAGLAFGTDMNTIESNEEIIQTHLDKVLPALARRLFAPFEYWRFFKLPADREVERHLVALHAAVQRFIADTRARLDADPALREHPSNLIEAMVAARDSGDAGALTDDDVSGNVLTMLLAGEDTTANTLAWMIWLLHRHPEAARRAAAEARALLHGDTHPTRLEQLNALDFIEACAHETMRIKPVAPINVTQAVRDTVVGGVALPAGTLVMCLMRPAAVDERHFPDPQAFKPERWLAGGAAAASSAKRVAMPFGAGPRICPGRYLALAEIKMVAAMLLASFEIADVATPDGGPAQERLALTMSPVGLKLRLRERAAA
jgi:cytochrome P450